MTAKEMYEKMILGEIKPENALSFFKTSAQECAGKILILMQPRPKNTEEQWRDMISPGSVGQQIVHEARRLKNEVVFINIYIKEAQDIIAKQKEEAQPDSKQSDKEIAVSNKEAAPEQNEQTGSKIISQKETGFIKYLKDAGQIEDTPGPDDKYDLTDNAENFIHWYIYNNYVENEKYQYLPNWTEMHINHGCTLETLKRYVREAKKIVPVQLQSEKKMRDLRENI